jgi:preprotein translocase subunit YajC
MATTLYAMAPAPAGQGSSGPAALVQFLPLVAIFVLFYFILLRPQQKAQKQRQEMVKQLKPGDQIVTSSGMYGIVVKVNEDDTLQVRIAENVNVKMARAAVDALAAKK